MKPILCTDVRGDPSAAVPLVLLHGFGMRGAIWRRVLDRLPPSLPTIVPDLPGHAGSLGLPPGGAGRMAKAVIADLDRRGVGRFHLCGHSLGGAMAALIALRAPERVASLNLFAPGGFGPEIDSKALADWRDAAEPAGLEAALAKMCAPGFRIPSDLPAELADARARPGAKAALGRIYDTLFSPDDATRQGVLPLEGLARLLSPISVLWGRNDPILPVFQAEGLPENIRVERFDKAGHMLVEERTDEVVGVLTHAVTREGT